MGDRDREVIKLLEEIHKRLGRQGPIENALEEINSQLITSNILLSQLASLAPLVTETNDLLRKMLVIFEAGKAKMFGVQAQIVPATTTLETSSEDKP